MNRKIKKITGIIHLWLGLASGLVVFIIAITGCILAFEQEIRNWTQPYLFVEKQDAVFLLPSELKTVAEKRTGGLPVTSVQYRGSTRSAIVTYDKKGSTGVVQLYMNPYTGEVLKEKVVNRDFFRIILAGHFYLWLPPKVGQPIVAWSVMIFVVLLITGLILWWPKRWNKANIRKSFTIKWKGSFKRVNYDLHNVIGFYGMIVALVLALTGLYWGFEWFQKSLYWSTSGGKSLAKIKRPLSDTTITAKAFDAPENALWINAVKEYDLSDARFQISFPVKPADPYTTNYNPSQTTYYKREFRYYDRHTLQELKGQGIWAQAYKSGSGADKLHRMNYDIHVGAIWGLPGKILMFFGSLIAASLPVTGFLVWMNRKKKKKKNTAASLREVAQTSKIALSDAMVLQPN